MSVPCLAGANRYVDYAQLPDTVNTIQAGVHGKLFWTSRAVGGGPPTFNSQIRPEANYEGVALAAAVTSQMGNAFAVSYDESNVALNVSSVTPEFRCVLPRENTGYPYPEKTVL